MPNSPAPWVTDNDRSPAKIMAGDDCIAMVYLTDPTTKKRDDVHTGNARLICAAPELLALVRVLRDRVMDDLDRDSPNPLCVTQADALLEKIDGL